MTSKSVIEGTKVAWPTLAVLAGLVLVGQLAIAYGRSLERQDQVSTSQDASQQERARLAESIARLEGKIDTIQTALGGVSSIEAKVLSLEKELERLERERRLMQDEIERLRGARP